MEILRKNVDLNIILNKETDFQTNAGWQENLVAFEDEILSTILNPIENYETVRYIHKPYSVTGTTIPSGFTQTDIWFYFYFATSGNTPNYVQDYSVQGITLLENEKMMKQSSESFFRLEFFKTPGILDVNGNTIGYQPPTRQNRKLVFAKNLSLPLGEKYYYTPLGGYIHLPVFKGSNYENKENMYFFWFQDESVLKETNLSGTTTGNTFFMTAKFFNAKDGSIQDFTNDCYGTSHVIKEENDMYYQVDIDKTDYSYKVYYFNGIVKCDQVGFTDKPISFFEKGGGSCPNGLTYYTCSNVTPTPTPSIPIYGIGLADEYETAVDACAGTTTTQTATYQGNLQIGTVLIGFNAVNGNTGFFKIISNSTETQYVNQILGVNDDDEVISISNVCITISTPTPTSTPASTPNSTQTVTPSQTGTPVATPIGGGGGGGGGGYENPY